MLNTLKSLFYRHAPDVLYAPVASAYYLANPWRESAIIYPVERGHWICWFPFSGTRFHLPDTGYPHTLIERYTLDDFVELESSDIVFDVGARTGTFTYFAATLVDTVVGIEPEPSNVKILELNAAERDNIQVIPRAAWKEKEKLTLNITESPSGHSLLDIDLNHRGGIIQEKEVQGDRVDNIANELGYDEIDFLKIDAEGVEPEVLEGATGVRIRKLAVDCKQGHDRSNWTIEEVTNILEDRGYEIRIPNRSDGQVFAKLPLNVS